MIKPLLRIIPQMSGNVKLVCETSDIKSISENIYTANIRSAKIQPLYSDLYQKNIEANLLNSSWEYDIRKFFNAYSDVFFESCFDFNKKDMYRLDKSEQMNVRNTDFEYGVKRISHLKSGYQFLFFAPIYITSPDDIPNYFVINVKLEGLRYNVVKTLKISLQKNQNNYIHSYLYKYVSKLDDNVIYMDQNNKTLTYYGINPINGGFTKRTDSTVSALFNNQIPIQMFDETISQGFRRNSVIMKQILPLAYYIDLESIMTDEEKYLCKFSSVYFSGYYEDQTGNRIPFYDFEWNYDTFKENIVTMNIGNGIMTERNGYSTNIMDMNFPAFNDRHLIKWIFKNKTNCEFCKWKLKYSDDKYPYIINMNWAYSINQNSNYKYKEFPSSYTPQYSFSLLDNITGNYNMILPLDSNIAQYNEINPISFKKYKEIMNSYCVNWFDIINTESVYENKDIINWSDVKDGKAYYRGILYDLNKLNSINTDIDVSSIDKFAFLIYPDVSEIKTADEINDLIFSKYTLSPKSVSDKINCSYNYRFYDDKYLFYNIDIEDKSNNMDSIEYDRIFVEAEDTDNDTPLYMNINDLGIKYSDINRFVHSEDTGIYLRNDKGELYNALYNWYRASKIDDKKLIFYDLMDSLGITVEDDLIYMVYLTASSSNSDESNNLPEIMNIPEIGYTTYEELPLYIKNMYTDDSNKLISDLSSLYVAERKNKYSIKQNNNEVSFTENGIYDYVLYDKQTFVDMSFFNDRKFSVFELMYRFCQINYADYPLSDINIPGTATNSLAIKCNNLYNDIISAIKSKIQSAKDTYWFNPETYYNKTLINRKIMTRVYPNFDNNNVSSNIKDPNSDNNVIYVHPYKFNEIKDKISETIGTEYTPKYTAELYGKILDKDHLFIMWNIDNSELYGDTSRRKFYKLYKGYLSENIELYDVIKEITDISDINYDYDVNMFYDLSSDGKKTYYIIVEKCNYIKIDKEIWNYINIKYNNKYVDMFIYRPLGEIEYDEKFGKYTKLHKIAKNDQVLPLGNILYHCFDDEYIQERNETVFFKNYTVNNISKVNVTDEEDNVIDNLYRYGSSNETLFVYADTNLKKQYPNVRLYRQIFNDERISFVDKNKSFNNLNIETIDGTTYAYYILKVKINNTNNMFNSIGIIYNSNGYDLDYGIKYVSYINGINIIENKEYVSNIFKQLCPFMDINIISKLSQLPTIVKPTTYSLTNIYSISPYNASNNSDELNLIYKKQTMMTAKKQTLNRYTDNIVPYIKETNIVNQYDLKIKDYNIEKTMIDTGMYPSLGDYVLYDKTININTYDGINIYGISEDISVADYNNVLYKYEPLEYKNYNMNKYIYLEKYIEIYNNTIYYDENEISEAESDEVTFEEFKTYMQKYKNYNIDEILFLYKKYEKKYDIIRTDVLGAKKYQIKYIFNLL